MTTCMHAIMPPGIFIADETQCRMFADVDHNHPAVRQDLFYWVTWLASQVRLGGLRLDAVKHYSASFLRDLVHHIDRTVGRDWFIVGEYWRDDSNVLSKFISFMGDRISLFDVRLVNNFSRLSFQDKADLRTVFDGSLASIRPRHAVVRCTIDIRRNPIADTVTDFRCES